MAAPQPAGQLVIVAEDEASLAALMARGLRLAGYEVLRASDGLSALAPLQALPAPADVLIHDIRMPRMSGPDEAVLDRRPLSPHRRIGPRAG